MRTGVINDACASHRRAVGSHRSASLKASSKARRPTRSTSDRSTSCLGRHLVGAAHRCAVGRNSSRQVPAARDLPSLVPALGFRWHPAEGVASARCGLERPRWLRPHRRLRRRVLHGRKKRGPCVGNTKRGKGTKVVAATDGAGLPLAIGIASASPHEVKVVEAALDESFIDELPERLVGDKAYDSDALDQRLWDDRGIKLISPHRRGRKRPATQDGRELRRYKRRWQVERLFAWLHAFRRIVTRYERKAENFLGFLHIACSVILLRQF